MPKGAKQGLLRDRDFLEANKHLPRGRIARKIGCRSREVTRAYAAFDIPRPKGLRLPIQLGEASWLEANKHRATAEIAAELKVHMTSVQRAFRQHGIERGRIARRRKSHEDHPLLLDADWIARQIEQGHTAGMVADGLGCSAWVVRKAAKEAGLRFPKRKHLELWDTPWMRAHAHMTSYEIGRLIGAKQRHVTERYIAEGIPNATTRRNSAKKEKANG